MSPMLTTEYKAGQKQWYNSWQLRELLESSDEMPAFPQKSRGTKSPTPELTHSTHVRPSAHDATPSSMHASERVLHGTALAPPPFLAIRLRNTSSNHHTRFHLAHPTKSTPALPATSMCLLYAVGRQHPHIRSHFMDTTQQTPH